MAQTGRITRRKLRMLAALDALGGPAFALLRRSRRPGSGGRPRRILVVELSGIGDVVLVTPLLTELRERIPEARITLLAKRHAAVLLDGSGLVDEVIAADFPWTAHERKYALSRYRVRELATVFRELRARRFDVSLDARRDLRSNLVTFLSGAARRIGYDFGGGAGLLTDRVASGSQNEHKIADWMRLLQPLLGEVPRSRPPLLRIAPEELAAAKDRLRELGVPDGGPVIAIHPGASHPIRRLREDIVLSVVNELIRTGQGRPLLIMEPGGWGTGFALPPGVPVVRPSLRELMGLIAAVDGLVCSDSAPMHIAAAFGTPVTAVFGPQRDDWYGPTESMHRVVSIREMPCRPCFDACIYDSPRCMDGISGERVIAALGSQLGETVPSPEGLADGASGAAYS